MTAYPAPVRRHYELTDGTISAVHFGRTENPLKVVLLHGNGFNAMVHRRVLEELGVHACALDIRGHGFTRLPTDIENLGNFHLFAADLTEFFERHIDAPVVLAGHSLGAVTSILAAPKLKSKLLGFAGFDPVSLPWYGRALMGFKGSRKYFKKHFNMARNAGRRKSVFTSPEEAFERYRPRRGFNGVSDQILRDYLEGGLELREDGAYHLCCAPLWEQAVYVAQGHNMYKRAHALPDNSHILYAGKLGPVSTKNTRRAMQKAQPNIQVDYDPTLEHLFSMQKPEIAVAMLKGVLSRASLGG